MAGQEEDTGKQLRAKRMLERDAGPLIVDAMNNPKTVEVMCNPDGSLWVEQLGTGMRLIGRIEPQTAEAIIKTVAGFHNKEVTRNNPLVEGEWPLDGSRFAGQLPPVVQAGTFAIRKKASQIFTLQQYVDAKIINPEQCELLKEVIAGHKNILVAGGTGSGKTTLINALIDEMANINPEERVVIIEDTGELQCSAENVVQYHTSLDVTMTDLLKISLRMRPDRILVGEVRGPEALDLLDAWNTGHPGGSATLHANSAREGLTRLRSLVSRNKAAPSDIERLIGEAVHIVVFIARTPEGRRVHEILEVSGYENGRYITRNL